MAGRPRKPFLFSDILSIPNRRDNRERHITQLVVKWGELGWEFRDVRGNHVVLGKRETTEPKCRQLIQNGTFTWNRIGENNIESGDSICCNEEQGFAEIKNLANFTAAQFLDSWKIQ
jgi:hypothetical protein